MKSILLTSLLAMGICTACAQNFGIGTTSPKAYLHVDNGSFLSNGANFSEEKNPLVTGSGRRLTWDAKGGNFFSGYVDGNQWDKDGPAQFSFSSGFNNDIRDRGISLGGNTTSWGGIAMGDATTANSDKALAMGSETRALSKGVAIGYRSLSLTESVTIGYQSNASAIQSLAIGFSADAGTYSTAIGYGSKTYGISETAIGSNNLPYNAMPGWDPTNQLFTIGNGRPGFVGGASQSNAFTVFKNGSIKIGNPSVTNYAKVIIDGGATASVSQPYYWVAAFDKGTSERNTDKLFSLYTNGRIWCNEEINVTSDSRTKVNIRPSPGLENLAIINLLKVVDYNYKDYVSRGNTRIKGFLAQQVEEVFADAVTKNTGFIPDIYQKALAIQFDSSSKSLILKTASPHKLTVGNKVKLITAAGERIAPVDSVLDGTSFKLGQWEENTSWVFVYGKEVNDLRNLDYNKIFSAGIGAIKELSSEHERRVMENKAMEAALVRLKEKQRINGEKLARIKTRANMIETSVLQKETPAVARK